MSFHSFWCHSTHSDVIPLIPMSFYSFRCHSTHSNIISSFRCHSIHSNLIPSFWRHSIHSDVIPFILSCLRWPRNDFILEWQEWPRNANFSHSRLILVILCYPRWSRKDGIFPFSSLSFRCHSVIRTSFWDQESIEMRSEWRMIWGRSRQSSLWEDVEISFQLFLDKPARLTIRVLWFLFLIVRRVPRPSESGCKKCNGLKKYLLGHTFSWKRLSAILCPWNPPWWWFFSLKLNKKCLKTPSKIKGLSFISSNLGNMDFFLIFNCISH